MCNGGCNGGWPWSALTDVEAWKGLMTEAVYPYTATTDACKRKTTGVYAPVTNYTCLSGPNSGGPEKAVETVMQAFSYSNGPLSIAMDAGILQTYSSGIIDPTAGECSTTQLDHASEWAGVRCCSTTRSGGGGPRCTTTPSFGRHYVPSVRIPACLPPLQSTSLAGASRARPSTGRSVTRGARPGAVS